MVDRVIDGTAKRAAFVTTRATVGAAIEISATGEILGVTVGTAVVTALGTVPSASLPEPACLPDNSMDSFPPSSPNKRFHSFLSFAESSAFLFWLF